MGTIVNVHGTFAHMADGATQKEYENLWWQPGSEFEKTVTGFVASTAHDGTATPLRIERFLWSGDNSENERRAASYRLLDLLQKLESDGEAYCVIGHSHGGSVVSAAMLTAASWKLELPGLKKWITVGTPFIGMRPLPRFVERLNLVQRVVMVASLMLLMMFGFYTLGDLLEPSVSVGKASESIFAWRNMIAAGMMSVPAIIFTLVFGLMDRRRLFFYRKSTIARARATFGPRWLSLCHPSDEAVQGLRSLPDATLQLFDRNFAAQRLMWLAVIALPVAYLVVLYSPSLMVSIADFLKTDVYKVDTYASQLPSYDAERKQIRNAAKSVRQGAPGHAQATANPEWERLKQMREELTKHYPEHVAIERALRFKHEFLEINGKPCAGGHLCGGGSDFKTNSKLLFHIVTDDVTSSLINDDTKFGIYSAAIRVAVPMVLVPVVFIGIALLFMQLLHWAARVLSALLAKILNRMTLSEIKREIYGNDTNGEVAYGAGPHPAWMTAGRPYLPADIARLLTESADGAASASLAKFRNAISTIAMSTGKPPSNGLVSNYLSWRELIHSSYFDQPEFRVLLARAVAAQKGFAPTPALIGDPAYGPAQSWLKQIDIETSESHALVAVAPPAAGGLAPPQPA